MLLTCAAVAVKPALVSPTPTTTLAGTVTLELLLERGTVKPPLGAAAVKETVHGVLVGVVRVVVVQLSALNATEIGTVIVPEPPVAGMGVPATVDAAAPVSEIGMLVVEGLAEIWNVAVATVPSGKVLVLNPNARQVLPEQLNDLPAAVVDDPATTPTRLRSEEKLKDHWRPAGFVPPPERLTGRETVPPGTPEADPIERETVWPTAIA